MRTPTDSPAPGRQPQARCQFVGVARHLSAGGAREARRAHPDYRSGQSLRSDEATETLHAAVAAADLVVLSFPLYIDSLPAPVIRALELIAGRQAGVPAAAGAAGEAATAAAEAGAAGVAGEKPAFVAICQCGFPEAAHNEVALEICAHFARAAGFEWAGGLGMGAGGMVAEQPLSRIRGRVRSVVRALDLSAAELAAGRSVPAEAVRLMAKPAVPAFAYATSPIGAGAASRGSAATRRRWTRGRSPETAARPEAGRPPGGRPPPQKAGLVATPGRRDGRSGGRRGHREESREPPAQAARPAAEAGARPDRLGAAGRPVRPRVAGRPSGAGASASPARAGRRRRPGIAPPPLPKRSRIVSSSGRRRVPCRCVSPGPTSARASSSRPCSEVAHVLAQVAVCEALCRSRSTGRNRGRSANSRIPALRPTSALV